MKNALKFLASAVLAIALILGLSALVSRPCRAQIVSAFGTLNGHTVNVVKTYTVAAGAATVADTSVTANSVITITLKTVGGTVAQQVIATITPGTGFTVTGGGSDTSTYNYVITN